MRPPHPTSQKNIGLLRLKYCRGGKEAKSCWKTLIVEGVMIEAENH